MYTTTYYDGAPTLGHGGRPRERGENELTARYRAQIEERRLSWTEHHVIKEKLGEGGQGVVFKSERRGADNFTLPVAIKVFSPEPYRDVRSYDEAMARIAAVSARVAQIQQDNLLDVHNFIDRGRIRMLEMEWIDGFDLGRLLSREMLDRTYYRVPLTRWEEINRVVITAGPTQSRLKPGIAIAVLRECLAALGALHRGGVVHGDIKPSNIMIKKTGNAKVIDIGSAIDLQAAAPQRGVTPMYAAPEVLENNPCTPLSDLASLGYVLVEILSGTPPFRGPFKHRELLEAKRMLPQRLPELLPADVVCNDLLMNLCRGLVSPDPMLRFPSAEAADLLKQGAADFLRQLVKGNLASEYQNDIRLWLEELE